MGPAYHPGAPARAPCPPTRAPAATAAGPTRGSNAWSTHTFSIGMETTAYGSGIFSATADTSIFSAYVDTSIFSATVDTPFFSGVTADNQFFSAAANTSIFTTISRDIHRLYRRYCGRHHLLRRCRRYGASGRHFPRGQQITASTGSRPQPQGWSSAQDNLLRRCR